jgi:hypothetical protein
LHGDLLILQPIGGQQYDAAAQRDTEGYRAPTRLALQLKPVPLIQRDGLCYPHVEVSSS